MEPWVLALLSSAISSGVTFLMLHLTYGGRLSRAEGDIAANSETLKTMHVRFKSERSRVEDDLRLIHKRFDDERDRVEEDLKEMTKKFDEERDRVSERIYEVGGMMKAVLGTADKVLDAHAESLRQLALLTGTTQTLIHELQMARHAR